MGYVMMNIAGMLTAGSVKHLHAEHCDPLEMLHFVQHDNSIMCYESILKLASMRSNVALSLAKVISGASKVIRYVASPTWSLTTTPITWNSTPSASW